MKQWKECGWTLKPDSGRLHGFFVLLDSLIWKTTCNSAKEELHFYFRSQPGRFMGFLFWTTLRWIDGNTTEKWLIALELSSNVIVQCGQHNICGTSDWRPWSIWEWTLNTVHCVIIFCRIWITENIYVCTVRLHSASWILLHSFPFSLFRAEPPATGRFLGARKAERPPSMWLAVNKVCSVLPNKRPQTSSGNIEGVVDFRWQVISLEMPQEPVGGTVTWQVWPTNQIRSLCLEVFHWPGKVF